MFVFCIMHRRPPRSTRTATLCPDTTRCRSSSNARFDCPLLVVFLTSPTRGASYYMGRPRNDHFKLLLTRDNYLCVALTPMLSHDIPNCPILRAGYGKPCQRSEEHTSELQSLMRISYAVFCLKKKQKQPHK